MLARSRVVSRGGRLAPSPPSMQQRATTLSRDQIVVDVQCMGRRADKIALRKGKSDAKKAKAYARMGKRIITVVKGGGPDPASNVLLSALLKQAQQLGIPKDILERNIKKASDAKQADYIEVTYECYGPGGTGFIIECLTDNVNRSASEVKTRIGAKGHGKVAEPGSVMFNFTRAGSILVEKTSEDALFEASMEAGGEDVVPVEEEEGASSSAFTVFSASDAFGSTLSKLRELGFAVNAEESELVYRSNASVEVNDEDYAKCESLMDRLLELDDVESVFTNCEGLHL